MKREAIYHLNKDGKVKVSYESKTFLTIEHEEWPVVEYTQVWERKIIKDRRVLAKEGVSDSSVISEAYRKVQDKQLEGNIVTAMEVEDKLGKYENCVIKFNHKEEFNTEAKFAYLNSSNIQNTANSGIGKVNKPGIVTSNYTCSLYAN